MLRLLKDVDNPFEYDPIPDDADFIDSSGSTEIDLGVLLDYRRILRGKVQLDTATSVTVAVA